MSARVSRMFSKLVAIWRNEHAPVMHNVCPECSCVVPEDVYGDHIDWHRGVRTRTIHFERGAP